MGGVTGFDFLPQIITKLSNASDETVVEACLQIQQMAQQLAPLDTGFLASSI